MNDDIVYGEIILRITEDGDVSITEAAPFSMMPMDMLMIADPRYVTVDGDEISILDQVVYRIFGREGNYVLVELVEDRRVEA
ncbi:hypothetical protein GCM10010149_88280 [Nonomuraea roseoviolacea subsp. roseoviolacea]|uniref:hypothetical protein n=1 Tax=Nonomuraea roseoviolacea TaxID=103837 RepID=UPI0031DE685F